jgi:hypothetical protein
VHHIAAEQAIPNPRPQAPTPATRCGNSRATVVRHLLRGRFAEGRRPRPFSGPAAATARATSVSCYSPASQPVPLACGTGRRHRAPLPEHCCHGGPLSVSPSTLSPLPSPPLPCLPQIDSSYHRATPRPVPASPHRRTLPYWLTAGAGAAWTASSHVPLMVPAYGGLGQMVGLARVGPLEQ